MVLSQYPQNQIATLFAILSLDKAQSLFHHIGLVLDRQLDWTLAIRKTIREVRASHEKDETAVDLGKKFRLGIVEQSEANWDWFNQWVTRTYAFTHENNPMWSAWQICMHSWAHQTPITIVGGVIGPALLQSVAQYMLNDQERSRLWDAARGLPLSGWDKEVYLRHQFDDGDDWTSPIAMLELSYHINQLQVRWPWLLSRLGKEGAKEVDSIAVSTLKKHGVWMPHWNISIETLGSTYVGNN